MTPRFRDQELDLGGQSGTIGEEEGVEFARGHSQVCPLDGDAPLAGGDASAHRSDRDGDHSRLGDAVVGADDLLGVGPPAGDDADLAPVDRPALPHLGQCRARFDIGARRRMSRRGLESQPLGDHAGELRVHGGEHSDLALPDGLLVAFA